MASRRNQFLQREPWAAPKVPPAKSPPITRRPPKRDPRSTPWRPAPKKPKVGPLFNPPTRPPKIPFGRRPPHVALPPTLPGKLKPLLRPLRLHPLINAGLFLWDLYDLWQWYLALQASDARPDDYQLVCNTPLDPPRKTGYSWDRYPGCFNYQPFDFGPENANPPPRPDTINGRWLGLWQESGIIPQSDRGDTIRWWYYADYPPGYVPHPFDGQLPVIISPSPAEIPYPYPFAPQPYPYTPPLTRPGQEPGIFPSPDPMPEPSPSPRPAPAPGVGSGLINPIPVVSWTPGAVPKPDLHERRPPKETEREKKKRLKPGTSAAWLKFLGQGVGSYTEVDDSITAIYKGLPWRLRRWRGRDGVWRDRDINSVTRAKRLYDHLGQLDIEEAIKHLVQNELTDKAFGTVGSKLKNKAKELGDEGLWSSSGGFQRGGSQQKKNWEEVYDKLKADAAKNTPAEYYWASVPQSDGSYRWVRRQRPMTQIPWFRQRSVYTRKGRRRSYYAPRPSLPINIPLEP